MTMKLLSSLSLAALATAVACASCARPEDIDAASPPAHPLTTTTTTTNGVVAPAETNRTTVSCGAGQTPMGCGGQIACEPAGTVCCGNTLCLPGQACTCR
jgi:hypothetical protein